MGMGHEWNGNGTWMEWEWDMSGMEQRRRKRLTEEPKEPTLSELGWTVVEGLLKQVSGSL